MKPDEPLSPEKQALVALRRMRAKLEEIERSRNEPIAVVGLGCRFPGAAVDATSFWRVLDGGVDTVSEIPRQRFDADAIYNPDPESRGTIYTRRAAFVSDIDKFDAPFFGISRREAVRLDPQQRMLLEVAWEALENAGQAPDALQGSRTGVFVGISSSDYGQLQLQRSDLASLDLFFGTGSAGSAAAGRLSYMLGLIGPSIAVDTACSASLVAVHLACQSLRGGECRLALAGGVNLNILPEIFVNVCLSRMVAPDGRCKAFDAAADGYVRGEGAGLVVLKRLSDAAADGDRILALIRATGVNQDGRSGGFTAPSELSQVQLLRDVTARAGITPHDVSYVEAHGTGTPLGDPIEMHALAAALCEGRPADRPLAVGSVKTNIGHLEAAAGIAGLIKVVLALQHRRIPPHLHLTKLNPLLDLNGAPIVVPTEPREWTTNGRPRIAGVSSFGFTGTNAHVLLEEAPPPQPASAPISAERPLHVLALSAKTGAALADLAAGYEEHLAAHPELPAPDVCFTANAGRAHFSHRLAIAAESSAQIASALAAWRTGDARAAVCSSEARRGDVAFLFTGQGSQYAGMGRELYDTQPVFRKAMDECDRLLQPHLAEPLLSVIHPAAGAPGLLDQTGYTQPALFALEYSLAQMWISWGVEPALVMGHSVGEYVAACIAGLFTLEDGLKLIAARSRLMQTLPAGGEMAAVFAPEAAVRSALRDHPAVSMAAINGPESMVISGSAAALRDALARLEPSAARVERLVVSHAFHSALMDPILDEFERIARDVAYATPRIGIVSNLTGTLADPGEIATSAYWRRHLRETVRFADGIQTLHDEGTRVFLEIGPSPTLLALGRRVVADEDSVWLPTLRRGRSDWKQITETIAHLYADHVRVDWAGFDAGYARRKLALPTYPFQRQSYWIEATAPRTLSARQAPPAEAPAAGDLVYELTWQEGPPATSHGRGAAIDRWLIVGDDGGLAAELARLLDGRASAVTTIVAGTGYRNTGAGTIEIDPSDPQHYERAVNDAAAGTSRRPVGIVFLSTADRDQFSYSGCEALLNLSRALTNAGAPPATLWIATHAAQAIGDAAHSSIGQATLWGFGRVLALEHPDLWGGLIDLDPDAPSANARALLDEILSGDEDQIAIRGGRRFAPRLTPRRGAAPLPTTCSPEAAYLITGGLGSLGLRVAAWLVDRGARHLVLVGRRGLPDRGRWSDVAPDGDAAAAIGAVRALEARGASVRAISADVTDRARMAALVDELRRSPLPLRGIVHAAGVSRPRLIRDLDAADLRAVIDPKAAGARNLHELTANLPLDFFVLFSSISSVWGSKGLAHYAAANHALDAIAHHRRATGLPALSVNWGPWSGGGMASDDDQKSLAAIGVRSLAPSVALDVLGTLLGSAAAQVTVADVDWNVFKPIYGARGRSRLFDGIGSGEASPSAGAAEMPSLRRRLSETRADERAALLLTSLQPLVAAVFGDGAATLPDPHMGFFDAGMDSLMAVELRRRLEAQLGLPLPATLAFDYPTVARLTEYLLETLGFDGAAAPAAATDRAVDEPFAMVSELSEEEVERLFAERVLNPEVSR